MNNLQSALWTKLESFQIDEGNETLTFEKKLARENGWPLSYSRRVIDEYKKFVFLCAASGHGCTPSDEVDQAWHLHICYTRSYWERLCGEVLGEPLHHNPATGGADGAMYVDWYQKTLDSYRELFGHEPPPDIWPPSQTRFAADEHCKRIDTRQNWVIPKRPARMMAGLLLLSGLAGCSRGSELAVGFLVCMGFIGFIVVMAISSQVSADKRRANGGSCGSGGGGCGGSSCGSSGGDCGGGDGGGGGCGGGCGGGGCGS